MREIMVPLYEHCRKMLPEVFDMGDLESYECSTLNKRLAEFPDDLNKERHSGCPLKGKRDE
jgi:hypothetical protein